MFRGRRRRYGRGGGGGMGMLFLGMQLFSFFNFLSQSDRFFPVTLGVMALNIVTYLRPRAIGSRVHLPSPEEACISVQGVWYRGDWTRVFKSPFVHGNDFHLYFNMASFMWKAVTLEKYFGSGYFAYMVSVFTMATGISYLAIHYMIAELLDQWSSIQSCAVGFSAVIFALKVVTTHLEPPGVTLIMGIIPVPTRLACWVELVIISLLFPNVSFVGHLSGILVGLAYVWGPLKAIMDIPISMINTGGDGARNTAFAVNSYTYRAAPTGVRGRGDDSGGGMRHGADDRDSEEEELQAALRSSLHDRGERHEDLSPRANRGGSLDRDLQIALDRSIHDSGPVGSSPPNVPPPPYNPTYPSPGPMSTSTYSNRPRYGWSREVLPSSSESEGEREEETGSLRQRHVNREEETDMDTVRAARLRRFERKQ